MQMALVGNEIKYCEKHLRNNTIDSDNPVRTIAIMIKYLFLVKKLEGMDLKLTLLEYMDSVGCKLDNGFLDGLIKTNTSEKIVINSLDKITITTTEWETIQELGRNERERKVLFYILCCYKIKVGLGFPDNKLVKVEYTKLNKQAHVTLTKDYRVDMFRYFIETGLVEMHVGKNADKLTINYVANGKTLIEITEFDCIDTYYKYLKKGGRLIVCQECGDLTISTSKTCPSKVCKNCARKINIRKTMENQRANK